MTKHNGKARKSGVKVGAGLVAAHKKGHSSGGGPARHTTDVHGGTNMQSVVERNDLDELMAMADLAGRDFVAERTQVIVVSSGAFSALDQQRAEAERAEAEARNAHRLRLPRRPAWDASTTPEQLGSQERSSFLEWRRDLAALEEEERLVLTPFEKNLEVWRQLWRVLERSDIVVQVVDARDPLLYRCEDLEAYARQLHASKASLLLLNKADLLPLAVRTAWAQYLDKVGVRYAFWSAHAVNEQHTALKAEAQELGVDWHELREERQRVASLASLAADAALSAAEEAAGRDGGAAVAAARATRVLGAEELLALLEERAAEAVAAAGPDDPRAQEGEGRRYMVGLVGYPNVGKSSTINALFGAKKTAVAPTPGKTKHFQTLIVSPTLCLCDCPGLVMPKFARSKAQMVAAGVIPIDRLTDMRGPIEVLAQRVGRHQVESLYGIRLPPVPHPAMPPTAEQLLRALASLRGWTVGLNLPDESRAGRQLLKDYTSGRLLHCTLPPTHSPDMYAPGLHDPHTLQPLHPPPPPPAARARAPAPAAAGGSAPASARAPRRHAAAPRELESLQEASSGGDEDEEDDDGSGGDVADAGAAGGSSGSTAAGAPSGAAQAAARLLGELDEADLDLLAGELGGLGLPGGQGAAGLPGGAAGKARRADHKFHKKAARSKGDRGQGPRGVPVAASASDGASLTTGKKGGLVRVGGYV